MNYFSNLIGNLNKAILFLPVLFAGISLTMIGSTHYVDQFTFTSDMKVQLFAYLLGFLMISVIILIDYTALAQYELPIYIASVLLLLAVYIPGLGSSGGGSTRWISLGGFYLQPAEVVKISFTCIFAKFLCRSYEELDSFKGLVKTGLYCAPFLVIVLTLPDLGNTIVFLVIAAAMVFSAGANGKLLSRILGVGLVSMPILYKFMASHQKVRIEAFLNPEDLTLAGNYQVWNSKVAIGSGGLFGKGLFQGTQKSLEYLPVPESDFIFSVIIEELGLLGGLALIFLYIIMLWNISRIARNAKDLYGSLVSTGILAMFAFQIFENIGMTMGLMPVTGITLPFISYGGSSILSNMVALGLVLNISMRSKWINF